MDDKELHPFVGRQLEARALFSLGLGTKKHICQNLVWAKLSRGYTPTIHDVVKYCTRYV